ncbi:daptide biosynthesis RiPP recognition protein [Motilibacter aurantiacus]|uniref:daptide biosynthesis RiPP recognition protein n=1 Tax=Motilibacter aurantiacus TaxID=2714955 RepID=UPI0014097621|nr:daptide biosynthesis RiPP recognition protein [Motilibacter aurantiacus]NHC47565.1 hypothetical protein [Motilibacter aurantiacus]
MDNIVERTSLQQIVGRLTAWARGDAAPDASGRAAMVVVESPEAVEWLSAAGTGIVGEETHVVVTRKVALPEHAPGLWLSCSGGAAEPGDELGIGRDFFLLTQDYAALRYLPVVGPTAVRLTNADDVEALAADIEDARRTGDLPAALVHRAVELGDRSALAGRPAGLEWLHVDRDGAVRCSPFAAPIGSVGDGAHALRQAAEAAGPLRSRLPEGVVDGLAGIDPRTLAGYAAALDGVRLLASSGTADWRVSGLGHQFLDGSAPQVRPDVLLLEGGSRCVLFDGRRGKAFGIGRSLAEVLETVLGAGSEDDAVERLARRGADPQQARALLTGAIELFAARGVRVTYATAA